MILTEVLIILTSLIMYVALTKTVQSTLKDPLYTKMSMMIVISLFLGLGFQDRLKTERFIQCCEAKAGAGPLPHENVKMFAFNTPRERFRAGAE
jgi:hypothetical protein